MQKPEGVPFLLSPSWGPAGLWGRIRGMGHICSMRRKNEVRHDPEKKDTFRKMLPRKSEGEI